MYSATKFTSFIENISEDYEIIETFGITKNNRF